MRHYGRLTSALVLAPTLVLRRELPNRLKPRKIAIGPDSPESSAANDKTLTSAPSFGNGQAA